MKKVFIILTLAVALASCTGAGYRKDILAKNNNLIDQIKKGDIESIPGFHSSFSGLSENELITLKESFRNMSVNSTKVGRKDINGIVNVVVNITTGGTQSDLLFQYEYFNDTWILRDQISITRRIDFIPKVEKVNP